MRLKLQEEPSLEASFLLLALFLALCFPILLALPAAEGEVDPVDANTLRREPKRLLVLRLDCVPVQHHFAVLLNDNRGHLTDNQQLQNVDGH